MVRSPMNSPPPPPGMPLAELATLSCTCRRPDAASAWCKFKLKLKLQMSDKAQAILVRLRGGREFNALAVEHRTLILQTGKSLHTRHTRAHRHEQRRLTAACSAALRGTRSPVPARDLCGVDDGPALTSLRPATSCPAPRSSNSAHM
jgi:hypothetical protein